MACKHQGGTDPCEKYKNGGCKFRQLAYNKRNNKSYGEGSKGYDTGRLGRACELLVRSDLLRRGYETTIPDSPSAMHDLHVDLPSVGWTGIQVRAGVLNVKTGTLKAFGRAKARPRNQSPVVALVYLPHRIEYRAGTKKLPKELR